jgi:hypothetical protein
MGQRTWQPLLAAAQSVCGRATARRDAFDKPLLSSVLGRTCHGRSIFQRRCYVGRQQDGFPVRPNDVNVGLIGTADEAQTDRDMVTAWLRKHAAVAARQA